MAHWWLSGRSHAPTLINGALVDVDVPNGLYRAWEEASADREGRPGTFPCGPGASGELDYGGLLISMDSAVLEYRAASGEWRALSCPPLSLREGYTNAQCRKLGFGSGWPKEREVAYLGLGRVMAWDRLSMRYDVYSFASRGPNVLRNADNTAPFFKHAGSGRLAGIDNSSQLLHLRLPVVSRRAVAPAAAATAAAADWSDAWRSRSNLTFQPDEPPTANFPAVDPSHPHSTLPGGTHVHTVLELLLDGSYRLWNSEGWAMHVTRAVGEAPRSPLAGPVGRGRLPPGTGALAGPWIHWTASPSSAYLIEVDTREGSYRTLGVRVGDMDTLQPATSRAPPLHFEVLADGALDGQPSACEAAASSRGQCALLGGSCGWCEQTDGVQSSTCTAGGAARPCSGTCAAWRFFDPLTPAGRQPRPPPPPSPPGLSEAQLLRLQVHTQEIQQSMRSLPETPGAQPVAEAVEQIPSPADEQRLEPTDPKAAPAADEDRRRHAEALARRLRGALSSLEQLALRPFDGPNAVPPQPYVVWNQNRSDGA